MTTISKSAAVHMPSIDNMGIPGDAVNAIRPQFIKSVSKHLKR